MKHADIATELNLKVGTVRNTCTRIEKATGSTNLTELLQHCQTGSRSGRPLKVQPGSTKANEVRTAAKKYKNQKPREVAQRTLNTTEIAASTARKILRDPRYCVADPNNKKKITRKKELQKNLLTDRHRRLREAYCDQIDRWYAEKENILLITTDEYAEHFGGSALCHVNADEGESLYGSQAPIQFSCEQWAACSEDTSVERPHVIWEAQKAANHKTWHCQLHEAKAVLRREVDKRRARCDEVGTQEHKLLHQKNEEVDRENEQRWLRRIKGEKNGNLH